MNKGQKRSALSYIPGLTNNSVLKLIIFCSTAYVMLSVSWAIILIVYQGNLDNFHTYFLPNLGLPMLSGFKGHWWTLLTYGIFQFPLPFSTGLLELVSNMVWLYCFGSVVQMLVGPRQVIPLFLYSLLSGGVFYLLVQLLPGEFQHSQALILGPRAGLIGMAAAAITLTPKYRFYLTETFSVPLLLVAGVFAVLMLIATGFYLPVIFMLAGGGLMGFGYVKLLRVGYRPGQWMYTMSNKLEGMVTPAGDASWQRYNKRTDVLNNLYETKKSTAPKNIDDILDKINQKGYNSLTKEERKALMQAGKDD